MTRSPHAFGKTFWLFSALATIVLVMGVAGAWSFTRSQRYLEEVHADFAARGEILTVGQCVEEVLTWREDCRAMVSLCDSNVERMTDACLGGQSREAFCQQDSEALSDSHYAALACEAQGLERSDRTHWKRCGMAYRAVDLHCKAARRDTP